MLTKTYNPHGPGNDHPDDDPDSRPTEYEQIANDDAEARSQSRQLERASKLMAIKARARYAKATPRQKALRDEFFYVVAEWNAGRLTPDQVRALTGDGFLRAMALSITPNDHPMYAEAMAMLDLLIETDKGNSDRYFTKHGWFSQAEIDAAGGRVLDETDQETGEVTYRIQFPVGFDDQGNAIWPSANRTEQFRSQQRPASPYAEEWYGDDADR